MFDIIPPHKSLASTQNKTGLPIGNYTSQFFANVYLDQLDQFVKHGLKAKYYLRYVDDLLLLHEDRKRLEAWEESIDSFLKRDLRLQLHPLRRKLAPVSNGCDFLGYVVRRTHLLARRRTVQNCREKLRHYEKLLVQKVHHGTHYIQNDIRRQRQKNDNMLPSSVEEGMPWPQAMAGVVRPARVSNHPALASATASPPYPRWGVSSQTYVVVYTYPEQTVSQLFATLMSYQGQFRHASSFRLWRRLFGEFLYLRFYVRCLGDKWTRKDQMPKRFGSLAAQYKWFARRFRNCLMFFQVGCFFEFYRDQAKLMAGWLRLNKGRSRCFLGQGVGIPIRRTKLAHLADSAPSLPLVVIRQTSRPAGGTLQRRLSVLYMKKTADPVNQMSK